MRTALRLHGTRMLILLAAMVVSCMVVLTSAAPVAQSVGNRQVNRVLDESTHLDANAVLMFVNNTGSFAYDRTSLLTNTGGLHYPKGSDKTALYAAGLWIGSIVDGQPRVAVAEYSNEFVPGPMAGGTYQSDRPQFRVYKISAGDTRLSNPDYAEWPFDQGAPAAKDHLGDDSLDAQGYRIPLLKGNQAVWTVFNDADPTAHLNNAGGSMPLGVEVQLYAYTDDATCAAGHTVNMEYTLINKGAHQLTGTYLGFWMDGDIGQPSDDLVGCDIDRSLGFFYNDGPDDVYGNVPPAVGLTLIQGPIVPQPGQSAWVARTGEIIPDHVNLKMSGFVAFINGDDPSTPLQTMNTLRGRTRDGRTLYDPTTGLPTPYMYSGDPVEGTGWLPPWPSDWRTLLSTGPFNMAPGDTQDAVVAVVVGQGRQLFEPDYDTIFADHIAGTSGGQAFALVKDPSFLTGSTYQITIEEGMPDDFYSWSLHNITRGTTVFSGEFNQSGEGEYPEADGLIVTLISPTPGVGAVQIVGDQQFTWQYANDFGFEGFHGAIGWAGPGSVIGFGEHPPVLPSDLIAVELRFANTDADGNFDPDDPNASYGYRYLGNQGPPARPEFAPYILNPDGGPYRFQEFTKNVPLSAWDVTSDPPRRLTVGFLENNVFHGTVDGKYWPPLPYVIGNVIANGPREWLWIYLDDYQETPKPEYMGSAIDDPIPIMYWCTMARRYEEGLVSGNAMTIIPGNFNTKADVFEFSTPLPNYRSASEIPMEPGFQPIFSCWPTELVSSLTALRRVDSAASTVKPVPLTTCVCQGRCDFNSDGQIDASDLNAMLNILFYQKDDIVESQCPSKRSDFNADGLSDVSDLNDLIAHIFFGGPAPGNPCE